MATRNFVPRANNEGGIGTSVKQWASGFFQKLAVGAITTAVTVLTPAADANNQQPATTGWVRSQFQSILKTVLSAAGLKYNIAQNGYICFGALFGGLILQWGYINANGTYTFPISYSSWNSYGLGWSTVSNTKHDYQDNDTVSISFFRDKSSLTIISSNKAAAISILSIGY